VQRSARGYRGAELAQLRGIGIFVSMGRKGGVQPVHKSLNTPIGTCWRMVSIFGFALAGSVAVASGSVGMQPSSPVSMKEPTRLFAAPALDRQFPLKWRMGAIDPRFGLDAGEAKQAVEQAIRLWESAAGTRLFAYDDSSGFPINLVYDYRHAGLVARRQAKERLDQMKADVSRAKESYQSANEAYTVKLSLFEDSQSAYRRKLDAYNQDVAYWNRNGGAPSYVVSRLDLERQNLERERERLKTEGEEVDSTRTDLNDKVRGFNSLLTAYNSAVSNFNGTFGKAAAMRVGETAIRGSKVTKINIFTFESSTHLAVILAHELGHALGLKHVAGQNSIMVAVEQGESASRYLSLSAADRAELRTRVLNKFRSKKN